MFPTAALASLRSDLAGGYMEFDAVRNRLGFIAYDVMPIANVAKPTGQFGRMAVEEMLKLATLTRTPDGGYARDRMKFEKDSYVTTEFGKEELVDENEATAYAEFFDAESFATMRALHQVLTAAEIRVAAAVFNTTTWTGASLTTAIGTTANKWGTAATAVPITDVNNAKEKVWDGCGMWPNTVIMSRHTFNKCILTTQVKDAIASAGAGQSNLMGRITPALLASAFDVERVLVAGGAKNTAGDGLAATIANIWDKNMVMVCKTCMTDDPREPGIGRTFHWSQDGSSPFGLVESYDEVQTRSRVIRVRHQTAEKVLQAQCGHLLTAVLS